MKYLTTFAMAAVVAMVLTASIGASAASATVLCEIEPDTVAGEATCPKAWDSLVGTPYEQTLAAGQTVKLGAVTCTKSTIAGKTTNTGSKTETLKRSIETLTLEECKCNGNAAHVVVLQKGSLETHRQAKTYYGDTKTLGQKFTVTCTSPGVSCIFSTSSSEFGTETNGSPGTLDVEASLAWEAGDASSFICSFEGTPVLQGQYTTTKPQLFYIADYSD